MAKRYKDWDARLPGLGVSAREYVARHAASLTDVEIASHLGKAGFKTQSDSVQKQRYALDIKKVSTGGGSYRVTPSPFARYDSPPTYEGDALVIGDLELPYHEADFVNRVLDLCQAWGIGHVWFNGDMVHHHNLSSWEPAWVSESDTGTGIAPELAAEILAIAQAIGKKGDTLRDMVNRRGVANGDAANISDEWAHARGVLKGLRQLFTSATLILGNHEGRFLSALDSPTAPDDLKRILVGDGDWMQVAPYYYGIVRSGGVEWRATHPKNTSKIPARVGAELAEKHHMNVLQSHNHLWGMVQTLSGQYVSAEIGCAVDWLRLPYASQRDNTRPMMQHGAAILRGGYCTLLHPTWSDWARLMKNR